MRTRQQSRDFADAVINDYEKLPRIPITAIAKAHGVTRAWVHAIVAKHYGHGSGKIDETA